MNSENEIITNQNSKELGGNISSLKGKMRSIDKNIVEIANVIKKN